MAISNTTRFVERLQFFDGQRLAAEDLQALEQQHRELRWLHNQSLHQPGVASGYAVAGNKGDREVTIQPGYAIDSDGREIVLTEPQVVPVPPVRGDSQGKPKGFYLTIKYPLDDALEETERREGICEGSGAVRRRELPVVCWVAFDSDLMTEVQCGRRIVLARADVINCQLDRPLALEGRRNAKPPVQPYVACGATPPGADIWKLPDAPDAFGLLIELNDRIDTTAAQFRTSPRYLAHVVGSRQFDVGGSLVMLDGFLNLFDDPEPETGFLISVLIPSMMLGQDPAATLEALRTQIREQWRVQWIGVEG
jgi:hypothetical protein